LCIYIYIYIYIYISHFYNTFIRFSTSRLLPKLGYCEFCCNKHGCAIDSVVSWHIPVSMYLGVVFLDHMVALLLSFWAASILLSIVVALICILTNNG
jgi:hypothetical protein